jgi:translation initiation factor IF-3
LDLVEVAPNANPPVCRIMDFGKFKFDEAQRAKESRRKATSSSIKEMKYRPKIGVGDFDTKTRQVGKFLSEGHKVKITIMFRGREMSHPELGKKLLDQVAVQVGAFAKVEAAPKLDGRNMIMVLAPDRRATAQAAPAARAVAKPAAAKAVHAKADAVPPTAAPQTAAPQTAAPATPPTATTETAPPITTPQPNGRAHATPAPLAGPASTTAAAATPSSTATSGTATSGSATSGSEEI